MGVKLTSGSVAALKMRSYCMTHSCGQIWHAKGSAPNLGGKGESVIRAGLSAARNVASSSHGLNRRRTPLAAFQTLLGLGAMHSPSTYAEITGDIAA